MAKNSEISIIICTHNRADMLQWSLPAYGRLEPDIPFEVIVVLNACTDRSTEVVRAQAEKFPFLRWVQEDRLGLSHARNTGAHHAKGAWLVYIDDDALPRPDLLHRVRDVVERDGFAAFSGHSHYIPDGSPEWIEGRDIEAPPYSHVLTTLPEDGFMNGCICGFKKAVLLEVDGFDPAFGMKGRHVAYGEEIELQYRLIDKGYRIAYHPGIVVDHRAHFTTLGGMLRAAFMKGRYMQYLAPHNRLRHLVKAGALGLYGCFRFVATALLLPHWQRVALDSFGRPMYHLGRSLSFHNRLNHRNAAR